VLDAAAPADVSRITDGESVNLVVADPPYNLTPGGGRSRHLGTVPADEYMEFSRRWVDAAVATLHVDAHFYVWLGADVRRGFSPLPEFLMMMREVPSLTPKNYITVRNQRGYGTQRNWMWVRQELLHYIRGDPAFHVVYTDIPKILRGYYKNVGGERTENLARGKSETIRPGNVWVDVQQVFYRMEENVPGAYAQKPLRSIERIIASSSAEGDAVLDPFAHSGTTLVAGERLGRRVFTFDVDPVWAEISIRRLERLRENGRTGFQCDSPFPEVSFELDSGDSDRG
jgi:site-specific DNA-methyltransferase (adenine-specific)